MSVLCVLSLSFILLVWTISLSLLFYIIGLDYTLEFTILYYWFGLYP